MPLHQIAQALTRFDPVDIVGQAHDYLYLRLRNDPFGEPHATHYERTDRNKLEADSQEFFRLFHFDADSSIIDSPGFQEFGLQQLDEASLARGFIEFRPFLGQCKFRDCRHIAEPGCKLLLAAQEGMLNSRRIACYHKLVKGLKKSHPWMETNKRV